MSRAATRIACFVVFVLSATDLAGTPAGGTVASTAQAPSAPGIPLCPGLTIATAVNQPTGDYESIKTIESISAAGIRIKYSAEMLVMDFLSGGAPEFKRYTTYRTVRAQDLISATAYEQIFDSDWPETIPNTTAISTSSAVLDALKTRGDSELSISISYGGQKLTIDPNTRPNIYDYHTTTTVKRAGRTVMLPVVVNDVRVDLPAIKAEGDFSGDKAEFFFLDQATNPLTLKFRIGIGGVLPMVPEMIELCETFKIAGMDADTLKMFCRNPKGGDRDTLQVVKISHRCGPAPLAGAGGSGRGAGTGAAPPVPPGVGTGGASVDRLEKALAETGRADIYSIYFSFNSDEIRPESEPTLREIADVLKRHPEWKLSIEGHTDSIATDAYNLDLSRRRAAAVKAALATRHAITAGRLGTAGHGESRPKDSNDTLEGRARNRRVELVRQP